MRSKWDIGKKEFLLGAGLVIFAGSVFLLLLFQKSNQTEEKGSLLKESETLSVEALITHKDSLTWAAFGWHTVEQKVLLRELDHNEARNLFALWDGRLKKLLPKYRWGTKDRSFPLPGYTPENIGGEHGEGYVPEGYDFFDGNRHGGHPAQDIFVTDIDQNWRDDATGGCFPVVSVSSGLVVSVRAGWEPGSEIRGGNYIYIYDPWTNGYYYYAHLDSIKVIVGQMVTCGEEIATLGRSGENAYPKRSPTHLHLMYLASTEEGPSPRNLYDELCCAKKVNGPSISYAD